MDPVQVWKDLSSKVEEKISTLHTNLTSAHSWFDEYYELAKAKVEGPGGAPTFVPKVSSFLLQQTNGVTSKSIFGSKIY